MEHNNKVISITINIENARKTLELSSGSFEQAMMLRDMTDDEIIDKVISHMKCYGVEKK